VPLGGGMVLVGGVVAPGVGVASVVGELEPHPTEKSAAIGINRTRRCGTQSEARHCSGFIGFLFLGCRRGARRWNLAIGAHADHARVVNDASPPVGAARHFDQREAHFVDGFAGVTRARGDRWEGETRHASLVKAAVPGARAEPSR